MGYEEEILAQQIKFDVFHDEDSKVTGIARLAIDKGFASLSAAQRSVLTPFLTQPCAGVTDPGGYYNECSAELSEKELLDAYEEYYQHECLLCQNCMGEANDQAAHKASFMKD